MTSQGPGLEILERLAEWSSEEIKNNIDHVLRELLISFIPLYFLCLSVIESMSLA